MSIRKKPDQAVPVLLARLDKAKEYTRLGTRTDDADDAKDPNSLHSQFKKIEDELHGMHSLLPRIKRWEKTVIEKFCELEQALDDDVFKEAEVENDIHDKVDFILKEVKQLKSLISRVDLKAITRKISTLSFKPKSQTTEEDDCQEASKEWVDLVDRGIEKNIFESEAMNNFFASFHCLESSQVKMCLLCLSIFPENEVIQKRPLIYWWIGEGLVAKNKNKTAEEVGEEVFQEILNEGFIKPSKENYNTPSVNSFVIDPWFRRMLILAAKQNKFITFSSERTPSNGLRRVFLWQGNESYGMSNAEKVEDVLTVFNVDEQYLGTRSDWLKKLDKVEVLQLGRWRSSSKYHIEVENHEELVNGLGYQEHLKYLSLRGISRIEYLPKSVVKLVSLKILDLKACHNMEKLPQGISALKNLTHLDVSECCLLESMPEGLKYLISLQVLKGFVMGRSGKNSCRIGDLNRLKNLRKLSVRIGNEKEAYQNDQLGSLAIFPDLQILTISWGVISSEPKSVPFPPSLRKLDLRCAPLAKAPEWMRPGKLQNLEKLYITGGSINSLAHEDPESWKVKYLRLRYLKNLQINEADLKSLFPEYLRLEKISCHEKDRDVITNKRANFVS